MNMNKEYRREICVLKKAIAKIGHDQFNAQRALTKLEITAIKTCDQTCAKIQRESAAVNSRASRAGAKIHRRIAVLQGRLA